MVVLAAWGIVATRCYTGPLVAPDGRCLFRYSFSNGHADNYWIDAKIIDELRAQVLEGQS